MLPMGNVKGNQHTVWRPKETEETGQLDAAVYLVLDFRNELTEDRGKSQ